MLIDKAIRALPWKEYSGIGKCSYQLFGIRKNTDSGRVYIFDFICNSKRCSSDMFEDFRLIISKKQRDYSIIKKSAKRGCKQSLPQSLHGKCYAASTYSYFDADEMTLRMLEDVTGRKDKDSSNHNIPELSELLDEYKQEAKLARDKATGRIAYDEVYDCPEEFPEGFEQWIRNHVLPEDAIIIYKRGNRKGKCHICGENITGRFTQSEYVQCPNCGSYAYCVLENSSRWKAEHVGNVIFAQKGKDGKTVWLRQIRIERDPEAKYSNLSKFLNETARYAIRGDKVATWQMYKHDNRLWGAEEYKLPDWERSAKNAVYDGSYKFCLLGLDEAISGTNLQYACLTDYLDDIHINAPNVVKYAFDFVRFPIMEFLYKKGFFHIVTSKVNGYMSQETKNAIRWQSKKLKDCFKFPLSYLQLMPPKDWTIEKIEKVNELSEKLSYDEIKTALDLNLRYSDVCDIIPIVSFSKLASYIQKQDGEVPSLIAHTYRDYLRECETLKYNMKDKSILFPKNLRRAHERTMKLVEYENNKELYKKFKKRTEELQKLAFKQDGYLVKVPEDASDLKIEGERLHHCVAGYIKDMAAGKTIILFIRRTDKPNEPFYTLEYRDGRVIQCRTKNNESYTNNQKVSDFVDKWLKYINKNERKRKVNGRTRKTA